LLFFQYFIWGTIAQNTRCFNPEFPQPPLPDNIHDCSDPKSLYFIDEKDPETLVIDEKTYGNPAKMSSISSKLGFFNSLKNVNVILKVNLILDIPDFTIFDCKFQVYEKVAIRILQNRQVSIRESKFWCCDKMWVGIDVTDGDHFTFANNKIEDAQYAIRATGKCTLHQLTGNTFDRNYIGIYTSPTKSNIGSTFPKQRYPVFVTFFSNKFLTSAPINSPYAGQLPLPTNYYGFAGIKIENMPASFTETELSVNQMNDLCVGILGLNASISINRAFIFSNMYFDRSSKSLNAPLVETHLDSGPILLGNGIYTKNGYLNIRGMGIKTDAKGKYISKITFANMSLAGVYQ
jgi:hypothetical protein